MKYKSKKWIFGAGAQGRITLEVWQSACPKAEFHFIDENSSIHGKIVNGIMIDGGLQFLLNNFSFSDEVIIAIGNNKTRLSRGEYILSKGLVIGNAIHTSAVIMQSAKLNGGCAIFPQAVVNTGVQLGKHVIVNTGAIVEHDSIIEDGVELCPSVSMGGRVIVGKGAFIGTGTVLAPRIKIGRGSVIGNGSVVVKDVPPGVLAYGVPARIVRKLDKTFDWSRLL